MACAWNVPAIACADGGTVRLCEVRDGRRITVLTAPTLLRAGPLDVSVLVPVLEEVVGWDAVRIRQLFASYGLVLQEWTKARTDWVTLRECPQAGVAR